MPINLQAESHQCCGEVTPYYLFHPEVPQRIKSQLPDVKLIVLLRDPVERALSQYFHSRRLGLNLWSWRLLLPPNHSDWPMLLNNWRPASPTEAISSTVI